MSESSYKNADILNQSVLLDVNVVFDNIKHTFHKFDIDTFVDEFNVWAFNRKLNEAHVDKLYNDLCEQTVPHLMGTIKVVKDQNGNFQVIDGQHRLQAAKRFRADHGHKKMTIYVEAYHVDSIDSCVVFDLFKMANSNLNISVADDLNMFVIELVTRLANHHILGKGIVDKNDGRVNKPRISKKALYELFKDNLKAHHMNLDINKIVESIGMINIHISKMTNLELFGRNNTSQYNLNMRCNAEKYNFYLNLPGKFPPEKWMDMISVIDKVM
jgi:hypothetical protein